MKIESLILVSLLFGANIFCMMEQVAIQAAEGVAVQLAGPLISSLASHASTAFHNSSLFSNPLSNSDSHSSGVVSALQTVAPLVAAAAPGLIQLAEQHSSSAASVPILPANNVQQAALGLALQAAQQTEQDLKNQPSTKARVLRILIGLGAAGFGAADLIVNYLYAQKSDDTTTGKKITSGVFSAGTDLGIFSFGAYQAYLGIVDWDNATKQKDASVATKLVQGHIAQLTQSAIAQGGTAHV